MERTKYDEARNNSFHVSPQASRVNPNFKTNRSRLPQHKHQ